MNFVVTRVSLQLRAEIEFFWLLPVCHSMVCVGAASVVVRRLSVTFSSIVSSPISTGATLVSLNDP